MHIFQKFRETAILFIFDFDEKTYHVKIGSICWGADFWNVGSGLFRKGLVPRNSGKPGMVFEISYAILTQTNFSWTN